MDAPTVLPIDPAEVEKRRLEFHRNTCAGIAGTAASALLQLDFEDPRIESIRRATYYLSAAYLNRTNGDVGEELATLRQGLSSRERAAVDALEFPDPNDSGSWTGTTAVNFNAVLSKVLDTKGPFIGPAWELLPSDDEPANRPPEQPGTEQSASC